VSDGRPPAPHPDPGKRRHRHRRGVSACRACGRKFLWCKTEHGKLIPFDEVPEPIEVSPDGRIETVSTEHVHWNTCTDADRFRRPKTTSETQ
jgi:hypothetical protein